MENQNCENCKYFARYYTMRRDRFLPMAGGYCIDKTNRKIKLDFCCEKWKQGENKKEEALKTTDWIIRDTNKRMNDIYKILQSFEEDNT